ncbi:MAG TPA: TIGR03118 family protein, partial [Xanthobacteraceae bacterium]|nr:TIGR03118 family protein [Xanthobacteraceae bacterium]
FAGDLLVGNFGNGEIHAYDLNTDKLVGTLRDAAGNPIQIDDLWALIPGNNGPGGHPHSLYFTAGVGDEGHGLFGRLSFHDLHM